MPRSAPARPRRRPANKYHHGDLRRALLEEAVRTIQHDGIEALTLRAVGARLRVSRTALYRHFADKSALLGAVSADGFAMLRTALVTAWEGHGRGRAGFDAMGLAYVDFALSHPAHYRVMFGGFLAPDVDEEGRSPEARGAFQALVDGILAQQQAWEMRRDDPLQLALYIWSVVHGVAMLAIDGYLQHHEADARAIAAFAIARMSSGLAPA